MGPGGHPHMTSVTQGLSGRGPPSQDRPRSVLSQLHPDNNSPAQGIKRPFWGQASVPPTVPMSAPPCRASASAVPSHTRAARRARPGWAGWPDLVEGLGQAESGDPVVGTQPYGHLLDAFCDRRVGPHSPPEPTAHPRGNPGIHSGLRPRTASRPGPCGWGHSCPPTARSPGLGQPLLLSWGSRCPWGQEAGLSSAWGF